MNLDALLRQYHENRAAMAPHLADYERRLDARARDELERDRRRSQELAQRAVERAEVGAAERAEQNWRDTVAAMTDGYGRVDPYAAHRAQYATDWTDEDAEAHRAEWGYGEDEIVRVADTSFSVR